MTITIAIVGSNPRWVSCLRSYSRWAAGFVSLVGFLVLVGWILRIDSFRSVLPSFTTMKVNTAIALLLCGILVRAYCGTSRSPMPSGQRCNHAVL